MNELPTVEVNNLFQQSRDTFVLPGGTRLMVTPALTPEYWLLRVPVSANQAIVGFPKFGTIGIGFQHEDDWNTNLPYQCCAEDIYNHIEHNKGDETIPADSCIRAIIAVQYAAKTFMEKGNG